MTLKAISPAQVHALRDSLEAELTAETRRQMRLWLADVRRAALAAVNSPSPNVLLAAAGDEMPGLGTIAGWWAERVDTVLLATIRVNLIRAFNRWTDQAIEASPAMEATNDYLAQVRNRLVLGMHFGVSVYEDSFARIRESLARSAAEGWTRQALAQRIAAELSWEKEGPYWRSQLALADAEIDSILDDLGEPGSVLREQARLTDPHIQSLRDARNLAIKHLDAERSVWQTRAMLIARTESTGGANFGAHQALIAEGVKTKEWVSTGDARTRPSHAAADGQEVGIDRRFSVGNALLRYPGDPSAPSEETASCRCALIQGGIR